MTEKHVEKLRLVTPIAVISNSALLLLIGWFLVNIYGGVQKQSDILFQKYDEVDRKVECLAHNIDHCCSQAVECV